MKKAFLSLLFIMLLPGLTGCKRSPSAPMPPDTVIMATTTSTYDSGLLHFVLPEFEAAHHLKVEVISVGTGQAIEIGKRGDADIILVHARGLEDAFVAEGFGTERWDVMYNDFIFLGPKDTPDTITNSPELINAMSKMIDHMERTGAPFLSRGDNSGTHNKEKSLWPATGIDNLSAQKWYLSIGQGMGDTLVAANEMGGFTLADRGTYLSMQGNLPNLTIVIEGHDALFNPYGIIPVNPDKHPRINRAGAMLLVEFFISDSVQAKIGEFGVAEFGLPLFFPDAKK